jgi:hypothetical protein
MNYSIFCMNVFFVDGVPSIWASKKVRMDMRNPVNKWIHFVPQFANLSVRNPNLENVDPSELIRQSVEQMAGEIMTHQDWKVVFDGSPISYLTYFQYIWADIDRKAYGQIQALSDKIRKVSQVILLRPQNGRFVPHPNLRIIRPSDFFWFDAHLTENYERYFW